MSIEVTLYPPKATRQELVKLLKARGFRSTTHLWNWPKGAVHFHWFETADFTSFDGVEASVFAASDQDRAKFGVCEWALHTRVRAGGSSEDRRQQNETIRAARKQFGGTFYNDWHGKNRYTPPDSKVGSPSGRGLYLTFQRTKQSLENVKYALPATSMPLEKESPFASVAALHDPVRTLYNGLVPFVVAALEHFFGQAFRIFLRYDEKARERLMSQTRKVEFSDAVAISRKEKTIEDVVADWYSFQSVESIHKAFNDWFGIDVWKLLRQRRKVGKRIDWLEQRFKELIEFRHGIVHRFEVNLMLDRQGVVELFDLSILLIEVFIEHSETILKEKIRDPF